MLRYCLCDVVQMVVLKFYIICCGDCNKIVSGSWRIGDAAAYIYMGRVKGAGDSDIAKAQHATMCAVPTASSLVCDWVLR